MKTRPNGKYLLSGFTALALGALALGALALGGPGHGMSEPAKPIDFSFALTCRGLEGDWKKRIMLPYTDAVAEYDNQSALNNHQQTQQFTKWEKDNGIEVSA